MMKGLQSGYGPTRRSLEILATSLGMFEAQLKIEVTEVGIKSSLVGTKVPVVIWGKDRTRGCEITAKPESGALKLGGG